VQQRHSQLQCGNTANLELFLLQSILVPSLHYGCKLWSMHSPWGAAKKTRTALQSSYDMYLRHICGVKHTTPSAMFLEELGLSTLQVWWRQTPECCHNIAASPVGSLFHTILLDNLNNDAFCAGHGAKNCSGSIATCLQSIVQPTPHVSDVVPAMEIATTLEALRHYLGSTRDYAVHCSRAAPTAGVVACTYHHWCKPFSKHRRYCQLPVSGRRMRRFLQFRLGSRNGQLYSVSVKLGLFVVIEDVY